MFQHGFWAETKSLTDPKLKELSIRLQTTVLASRATGTVNGYIRAFNRWKLFAATSDEINDFPARPLHVALYLQHLIVSTKSHSSVDSAFYAIKWAHENAGLESPTDNPLVVKVREAAKRILGTEKKIEKHL